VHGLVVLWAAQLVVETLAPVVEVALVGRDQQLLEDLLDQNGRGLCADFDPVP